METKVLRLVLDNSRVKPVFPLQVGDTEEIICLLDSGAGVPIWCRDYGTLRSCFPQIVKLDKQARLSGFGGNGGCHDVYRIPLFSLSYGAGILRIHNFIVILAPNDRMGCDLILGSCVFNGKIDYTVETRNKIHYLVLRYDREDYTMFIKDSEKELRNAFIAANDKNINPILEIEDSDATKDTPITRKESVLFL